MGTGTILPINWNKLTRFTGKRQQGTKVGLLPTMNALSCCGFVKSSVTQSVHPSNLACGRQYGIITVHRRLVEERIFTNLERRQQPFNQAYDVALVFLSNFLPSVSTGPNCRLCGLHYPRKQARNELGKSNLINT